MPAYVIADIEIQDSVRYEDYKRLVPLSISKYGGRFLARGGEVQTLEGEWSPGRFVILEFPSLAQARQWWDSPEYAPAKALRRATSTGSLILVEGL
jgi:uncharacterized protein (DUF1330 family)